ncbi:MAG: hypothetical protein ACI8X3_001756 [Saprospiraceae bacterium]
MNPLKYFTINRSALSFYLFFLALLFAISAQAQVEKDSTTVWQVKTKDGNTYVGTIIFRDNKITHLKTESLGMLVLRKKDIKFKIVYDANRLVDGEIIPIDKLASRNMLTPTGILQQEEQGYYENKYLFINHFNLALSDGFSLGLGMMPLFLFGESTTPIWIVPKIRIKTRNERLSISTGLFWSRFIFDSYGQDSKIWIAYGMGTYGTENISFSAGIGYGYFDYYWLKSPVFSFSGKVKVSKRSYLFVESILINTLNRESYYGGGIDDLYTFGARTAWRNVILDYGLLVPTGEDIGDGGVDLIAFPYLGLVIPLGKK